MLRELSINNFAIIGGVELSLGPGMTCLTGETGAGKSILVDALSFILGGRPGPGTAADGGDTAVEAVFDVSGVPEASSLLEELGLEADGELVIRRAASSSGRGRAYLNGSLVNLGTLQRLGEWLVDIHGQHEHQSLLKVERHMELLDEFCDAGGEKDRYKELYDRVSELGKRLAELKDNERERARRQDLLGFQVSEIEAASLTAGEEEALMAERARLAHADRLRELAHGALEDLREKEQSALLLLGGAKRALTEIASVAPGQAETLRLVESALISAEEASSMLRDFSGSIEADPGRLDEVEGRLELIASLKKKYGDTVEDVLEFGSGAAGELELIGRSAVEISALETELARTGAGLMESGERLGRLRRDGAGRFSERVCAELSGMGMPKAVLTASFSPLDRPGPTGLEKAEFMFSANPGRPPMPLARIASGGELSRVMLALKVVLSLKDTVPTLVFDEVDSGVGGVTAVEVGKKLRQAARGRQVLCVTHLPQIASLAAEHFTVHKIADESGTEVVVRRLDRDERVLELARMLGGGEDSKTACAHARELVRQGEINGQA